MNHLHVNSTWQSKHVMECICYLFSMSNATSDRFLVWRLGGTAERVLTFGSLVLASNPVETVLLCLRPANGKVKYARRPYPCSCLGGTAERVITFGFAVLGSNPAEAFHLCLSPANGKVKYARRPYHVGVSMAQRRELLPSPLRSWVQIPW